MARKPSQTSKIGTVMLVSVSGTLTRVSFTLNWRAAFLISRDFRLANKFSTRSVEVALSRLKRISMDLKASASI